MTGICVRTRSVTATAFSKAEDEPSFLQERRHSSFLFRIWLRRGPQQLLDLLERRDRLLARDRRIVAHEVAHCLPVLEVVEEHLDGHACAREDGGAAVDLGVT